MLSGAANRHDQMLSGAAKRGMGGGWPGSSSLRAGAATVVPGGFIRGRLVGSLVVGWASVGYGGAAPGGFRRSLGMVRPGAGLEVGGCSAVVGWGGGKEQETAEKLPK